MAEKEIEFNKLNLSSEDILILKVNTYGLSEKETTDKLTEVRNDEFVKYIEEQGNKVVVSYTGLDFQILRLNEGDKVLAYADVSSMTEAEEEKYIDYIKFKLGETIPELICVPVRGNSPKLQIKQEEENNG